MPNISVYGHFYQPPREDPWSGRIPADPTAAPAHDWNERVYSECYKPNAAAPVLAPDGRIASIINNYSHLSFDFGPTLHRWIAAFDPILDRTICESGDRAVAQAYNHMIMPLAEARDKKTQVLWGIRDFEYRFGRKPKGMWLPETAVDTETLSVMAECGVAFTILAPRQCAAVNLDGSWRETDEGTLDVSLPYFCVLPSGKKMDLIFYHGGIAQQIAFGALLDNGDRFREALLSAAAGGTDDRILVVATDGESYGHHHKFGDMALARLFQGLLDTPEVRMPDLGAFLEQHPPQAQCRIRENTSWSCEHGIERWRSDCGCHTGGEEGWNQKWRGPLRDALDSLRDKIDECYEARLRDLCDPWQLRDGAVECYLNENDAAGAKRFLDSVLPGLDEARAAETLALVEAQRLRMLMYASCGWFFNDIGGVETKIILANAVRAAQITQDICRKNLLADFAADLEKARGNTARYPTARTVVERDILPRIPAERGAADEAKAPVKEKAIPKGGPHIMNFESNLAQSVLSSMEHDPAFRSVAYFSMEIGLCPEIPTYSGGLGVLAGDILKSSADLGVPMVGVTLLYKKGYFAQKIGEDGRQTEEPVVWNPSDYMTMLPNRVPITMNQRKVAIAAWVYPLEGESGYPLPIIFLDTDLPENAPEDRNFTAELYGGDNKYRLCQELILGIGGLRMLRDLGFRNVKTFHLNEGHAGFITLELLREQGYGDIEKIRNQVVFTTHTPVAAGHDFFSYDLINEVNEKLNSQTLQRVVGGTGLSMTDLALHFSRYVNGVSHKHAEVSRAMFKDPDIDWVTNGVHSTTWTSPHFAELYDKYIPGWRNAPERLSQALHIPDCEIWDTHQQAKLELFGLVLRETGVELDPDVLTIGFARRAATYKRADLVFSDIKRLLEIGAGKIQFVFSGKAHPHDEPGKDILQKIHSISEELGQNIPVVFIENYNMGPAKLITAGVDLWLNTPMRPREASGTSGMKCTHNGVMNFSILDGWWIEGCLDGQTGWAIGAAPVENDCAEYNGDDDAADLYNKLQQQVLPTYYDNRGQWIHMMKMAIAVNASYFNTHRTVREYCEKAYKTVFRGH